METIEAELADIEKRIAEYDARFAAATAYDEADYKAYNELKTRYDRQMHEWEKASYELEITEGRVIRQTAAEADKTTGQLWTITSYSGFVPWPKPSRPGGRSKNSISAKGPRDR